MWIGDNEVAWRTEQTLKRMSPLNPCATTTTVTTTTGGGASMHLHLSPPTVAPVSTPDLRSPSTLQAKLGFSPGQSYYIFNLISYYNIHIINISVII